MANIFLQVFDSNKKLKIEIEIVQNGLGRTFLIWNHASKRAGKFRSGVLSRGAKSNSTGEDFAIQEGNKCSLQI